MSAGIGEAGETAEVLTSGLAQVIAGMAKRRKLNRNPDHGKGLLKRLAGGTAHSVRSENGEPAKFVLMNFEVSWEPLPDATVEALPEATRDRMKELFELAHDEPKKAIQELRDLIVLHPDVPCLRNWLIHCLRAGTKADRREAMVQCEELFRRMPDYFFARTTLADLWLDEGAVEKAAELIFATGCVLTHLYPERKVFHISELRHWFYLSGRIKILLGELGAAESYRDLLDQLEPDSQAVRHLNLMLERANSPLMGFLAKMRKAGDS